MEIKTFLATVMPFSYLQPEELKSVSGTFDTVLFPPGAVIINRGDPPANFYLIENGLVRVYLTGEMGEETVVAFLGEGDCFGEMSLLTQDAATAAVEALESTCCLIQKEGDFLTMVRTHPDFSTYFSQLVTQRIKSVYKELLTHQTGFRQARSYLFSKRIGEMCSPVVVFLDENMTVREALKELIDRKTSYGLVVGGEREPKGIIGVHTVAKAVVLDGLDPETKAGSVVDRGFHAIEARAFFFDALHGMVRNQTNALVVMREGEVVGLLSGLDLLRFREREGLFDMADTRSTSILCDLAVLGAAARTASDAATDERSAAGLFDYFAVELFDALPRRSQEFLLRTSFLPFMTPDLIEKVTGFGNARKILMELNQKSYFTESYLNEEHRYQYHPLFRNFLRSTALARLSASEVKGAKQKAGAALIEAGHVDHGVPLLIQGEEWETAVKVILDHAENFVAQSRFQTLRDWILSIPARFTDGIPWLHYWLALCIQSSDPQGSRKFFSLAFSGFQRQNDTVGLLRAWTGGVDSAYFEAFQGAKGADAGSLDPFIDWLEEYLREGGGFPSETVEAHVAAGMTIALLMRRPHLPGLTIWLDRALSLARRTEDQSLIVRTFVTAINVQNIRGEYRQGLTLLEEMSRMVGDKTTLFTLGAQFNLALLQNQLFPSGELALAAVRKGLKMAEESGIALWTTRLLAQGAYACLNRNEPGEASEFLKGMEHRLKGASVLLACQYYQISAMRAVSVRDIPAGLRCCEEQLKLALQSGCPWVVAASRLHLSLVFLRSGDVARAREELAEFHKIPDFSAIMRYSCLLIESEVMNRDGDHTGALNSLREALGLGRANGYSNMFYWWDPGFMIGLYTLALKNGIETGYVRSIIKARDLLPDTPPLDVPDWPWHFRVCTLGGFSLFRDDTPLVFEGRERKKPLALLKAMLSFGGRQVPENTVTELLWPDAPGDAAHSAYTTTLSRLRRLLGHEKAIEVQGGKASFNPRYFWIDLWLFEDLCERVEILKKRGDQRELRETLEKAAALYKGPFLSREEDYWFISPRESLHRRFIQIIEGLGDILERNGEQAKAITWYEVALEADDGAEEFYRRLISCYGREGRHAEAMSVYHRCERTLSSRLAVQPSPQTQALIHRLKK